MKEEVINFYKSINVVKGLVMKGNTISREYQRMVWVRDEKGAEYVCYAEDLMNPHQIDNNEKKLCHSYYGS